MFTLNLNTKLFWKDKKVIYEIDLFCLTIALNALMGDVNVIHFPFFINDLRYFNWCLFLSICAYVYRTEKEQFCHLHTPIEKTKRELYSLRNRYPKHTFSDKMIIEQWNAYAKYKWHAVWGHPLNDFLFITFYTILVHEF